MKDTQISNIRRRESLWLKHLQNLPWVAAEMAAKAPRHISIEHFWMESKTCKQVKDG
jgi:hypothetical protein